MGSVSEILVEKIENDKLIVCPGENKPTDSDWIGEKVRLEGTEARLHSPEILPTNPISFQAAQEPPS